MHIDVYAKAALLNDQGKVLVLRRSLSDVTKPGEQDFPGGQVEPGEELTRGMVREILEETGIRIEVSKIQLVYAASEAYEDKCVTRLFFIARVGQQNVQLSFEHDQYRWLDIPETLIEFPHPVYGVGLKYAVDNGLIDLIN